MPSVDQIRQLAEEFAVHGPTYDEQVVRMVAFATQLLALRDAELRQQIEKKLTFKTQHAILVVDVLALLEPASK